MPTDKSLSKDYVIKDSIRKCVISLGSDPETNIDCSSDDEEGFVNPSSDDEVGLVKPRKCSTVMSFTDKDVRRLFNRCKRMKTTK